MWDRYQLLRQAISQLASGADEQHAYLESILGHLTPDGDARGYGNYELAEEFNDIYLAVGHMRNWGEISQDEIDAVRPLNDIFDRWRGEQKPDFWRREALWSDPRWEQVRQCARQALSHLPDEQRPSAWVPGAD